MEEKQIGRKTKYFDIHLMPQKGLQAQYLKAKYTVILEILILFFKYLFYYSNVTISCT